MRLRTHTDSGPDPELGLVELMESVGLVGLVELIELVEPGRTRGARPADDALKHVLRLVSLAMGLWLIADFACFSLHVPGVSLVLDSAFSHCERFVT